MGRSTSASFASSVARVGVVAIALGLAAALTSFALEVPDRPLGRVSDYAGLIDAVSAARIERLLEEYERESTSQIAVAIFPSLEGEDLTDFSSRLFERWNLGQRERDNGVLLAIFLAERKVRIEVGYGLEGRLTDAVSARILSDRLAPRFREGKPAAGVEAACRAIVEATKGEFEAAPRRRSAASVWFPLVFVLLILLGFFVGALLGPSRRGSPRGSARSRGATAWGRRGTGGLGGGGFFGGGGSFGGGGFSGGGGMSGGGGASGGW